MKKKYSNGDVTVLWEPGKCINSAKWFKKILEVFDSKAKPWINIEGADTNLIWNQMKDYPSFSLSILEVEKSE